MHKAKIVSPEKKRVKSLANTYKYLEIFNCPIIIPNDIVVSHTIIIRAIRAHGSALSNSRASSSRGNNFQREGKWMWQRCIKHQQAIKAFNPNKVTEDDDNEDATKR